MITSPNSLVQVEGTQILASLEWVAENLPIPSCVAAPDGTVTYLNTAWCTYCGATPRDTEPARWSSFFHPDDLQHVIKEWTTGTMQGVAHESEYRLKRVSDGAFRWHRGRMSPLRFPSGEVKGWLGTIIDVHDEKLVRIEEERLRFALDRAPVALWAVNLEGIYTFIEGGLLSTIEQATRPRAGTSFFDKYKGHNAIIEPVLLALAGQTIMRETEFGGRWWESTFAPIYDGSAGDGRRVSEMICVTREVTDRKLGELQQARMRLLEQATLAAEEASRLKSEFLANMSHEIRTPLGGVLGMISLLLETELTTEGREFARTAKRSAESLLSVINDILDFSKVEAGKLSFEDIDFSLSHVLNDVKKSFDFVAVEKGLWLQFDVPSNDEWVRGDAGRLRQVLTNLVGNALKFTSRGGVNVRVQKDGETFRFEVADSGIGLPAETLARLFRPFTQSDSSTTRRYGGTGLGLSIVKGLVEGMGGACGARSAESEGSVFWFTLTLPKGHRGPLESNPQRTITPGRHAGARILVAEDNPVNTMLVMRVLAKNGYEATAVENGLKCLEAYASGDYDLLLLDCQMPELDGYETARRLRSQGEHALPIIALTANALDGEREKCLACGMDDYLSKPLHVVDLQVIVERWLDRGAARRTAATASVA